MAGPDHPYAPGAPGQFEFKGKLQRLEDLLKRLLPGIRIVWYDYVTNGET